MCSPSRAFWGAPRAIVGLKRGGGGWCILASAMTERVVASSHANSRLPSKPSTRGGVGRRTLRHLKTNLLPCLGLLEYGRVRCVLPPGLALRRVRMRGRRSEYAEFPRGGRPRARPSALLGPYSALLGPGPAASSHARSPERVRRVPEGGSPPGPAERPRSPLLAQRPPRGRTPTRASTARNSGV